MLCAFGSTNQIARNANVSRRFARLALLGVVVRRAMSRAPPNGTGGGSPIKLPRAKPGICAECLQFVSPKGSRLIVSCCDCRRLFHGKECGGGSRCQQCDERRFQRFAAQGGEEESTLRWLKAQANSDKVVTDPWMENHSHAAAVKVAVPAADANIGTSAPLIASLAQRVCAGSCC